MRSDNKIYLHFNSTKLLIQLESKLVTLEPCTSSVNTRIHNVIIGYKEFSPSYTRPSIVYLLATCIVKDKETL